MSKVYIYKGTNNNATIYYDKEYPEAHNIPVFEYEGEIPEGPGVLKTDGEILYLEVIEPVIEPEPEPTTDDILNVLLGVTI